LLDHDQAPAMSIVAVPANPTLKPTSGAFRLSRRLLIFPTKSSKVGKPEKRFISGTVTPQRPDRPNARHEPLPEAGAWDERT
jgi:hypothetical protein